ncbi:F-box/kelch-repeat protein [Citrus sinensis]|nr:F-box/kelch-repeat protein [Citrus sinensis]
MAVGVGAESKRMKIERQWSSSWSRLPEDIIFSIMNRLGYVGQLRFRAVCKSWRQANIRGIKSADTLPWKMAVLASKYGWVLFAKRENDEEEYPYMTNAALFLYTPFTNRIIHLPNFILKLDRDKKLLIRMCRPGETTWIKLAIFKFFDTEDSSEKYGPAHNVEYVDGVLYISFEQIAVVAYNPKLDDSKLYPYPCNEGKNIVYEYLFESDGNLLLYHDELDDLVFRLDRPQMNELVNTRHAVVCHCSMCTKISGSFHLDVRHMEDYCWIQVPQMI